MIRGTKGRCVGSSQWNGPVFPLSLLHLRDSGKETRDVKGIDKVLQLFFFFFYQAVTLNDYTLDLKQECLLLSYEYSNNFIWPRNKHISDKWMWRADIPILKETTASQRELVLSNFQRNTLTQAGSFPVALGLYFGPFTAILTGEAPDANIWFNSLLL